MKHVLQAVNEQLSLNAVRSLGEKLTPQARVLVDMAKAGTCGQPAADRQQHARLVLEVGQFGDDAAAAEALIELSKHLDLAEDSPESHELCARAVGEAWRRHAPFRVSRAGDPLDVLTPHLTPAEAVLALDRARALPPAPAAALLRRTYELDRPPSAFSFVPYSRSLALALLGEAELAHRGFLAVCPKMSMHGLCARLTDQYALEDTVEEVARLLTKLRVWIESEPGELDTGIIWPWNRLVEFLKMCIGTTTTAYKAALRLESAGYRLHVYVKNYADLLRQVERNHASTLEEKRRLFPDFYPEG